MSVTCRVVSSCWGQWEAGRGTAERCDIQGILDLYLGTQPSESRGPEASSPSLSNSAHGYGVPRPTDQEMVEMEAGQGQMPGEGSPGPPSHRWPSEGQIPRVCLLQTPLTPSPLGAH
ncbi:hypothetical protein VULLAG_LOCUS424 [Vulpes lagopus]